MCPGRADPPASGLVVAVDGPSGSGKSTVSRAVAGRLGLSYLDTGAMYRAVTWRLLSEGVDPQDRQAVAARIQDVVLEAGTDPTEPFVAVDGDRVSEAAIRAQPVSSAVSAVSAVPEVRRHLVAAQRQVIAAAPDGIVVEGRDIAAVVAPDAPVKVFLTADESVRVTRRTAQADAAAARHDVGDRDSRDDQTTPLRPAPGAVLLDTSAMSGAEVVEAVLALCATATTSTSLDRQ